MINVLFMGIDFVIFCVFCRWFLKRYTRSVTQEMEQEQLHSERLVEYRDGLQKQMYESHRAIEDQALTCQDLSCKVMVWKQHFEAQRKRDQHAREVILKQVHEKYVKQMVFRQHELYRDQVADAVMRNVRSQVYQKFDSRAEGEQYNDTCLRVLEQGKRAL